MAAVLLLGASLAGPATAKKGKGGGSKGAGSVDITKPVAASIPDRAPGVQGLYGSLTSTIEVGKQFKGQRIRDVNVTVQTLGATGTNPADDLAAVLTAPNGASVRLFAFLDGFTTPELSIGPLTLDDESANFLGGGPPVAPVGLYQPWAGTAQALDPLALMDDGSVRGTWTLRVLDQSSGGAGTSVLSSWRLNVVPGRPFRTP